MSTELRIISALYPHKFPDDCAIYLKVWFEGYSEPLDYVADPFDPAPHGRELWFRAMMGEYGQVAVMPCNRPVELGMLTCQRPPVPQSMKTEALALCLMDLMNARNAITAQKLKELPTPEVKNDA